MVMQSALASLAHKHAWHVWPSFVFKRSCLHCRAAAACNEAAIPIPVVHTRMPAVDASIRLPHAHGRDPVLAHLPSLVPQVGHPSRPSTTSVLLSAVPAPAAVPAALALPGLCPSSCSPPSSSLVLASPCCCGAEPVPGPAPCAAADDAVVAACCSHGSWGARKCIEHRLLPEDLPLLPPRPPPAPLPPPVLLKSATARSCEPGQQ
jgi:hypothetical protein